MKRRDFMKCMAGIFGAGAGAVGSIGQVCNATEDAQKAHDLEKQDLVSRGGATRVNCDISQARADWVEEFGDPSDPEVMRQIEETADSLAIRRLALDKHCFVGW